MTVDAGEHTNWVGHGTAYFCTKFNSFFSWTNSLLKFPSLLCGTVAESQQGNVNTVINFIPKLHSYTILRRNHPGSFPSYHFDADNCQHPGSHMLKMDQAQDRKNLDL